MAVVCGKGKIFKIITLEGLYNINFIKQRKEILTNLKESNYFL